MLLHVFISVLQQWAYFHVMINNFLLTMNKNIDVAINHMFLCNACFSQLSRIRVDIKIDTSIHNLKLNIIICTCRNHSLSNYEVIILVDA